MSAKLTNAQIACAPRRICPDGAYVNLGIGFPEMIAKFKPEGREVTYHTEIRHSGFRPRPPPAGSEDWDLINAGKKAVTLNPRRVLLPPCRFLRDGARRSSRCRRASAPYRDCLRMAEFFFFFSGQFGSTGPGSGPGPSAARWDLVHGAKQVWGGHRPHHQEGPAKLVERCTLPLTGVGWVTPPSIRASP